MHLKSMELERYWEVSLLRTHRWLWFWHWLFYVSCESKDCTS